MKTRISNALGVAIGTAAFAIMTGQGAAAGQSQPSTPGTAPRPGSSQVQGSASSSQITISGCIMREADYRKSTDAGRGGVLSTGIGEGNEFILTNAMMAPAGGSATAPTTGAAAPGATGTAGTAGPAYELTGSGEGGAAAYVGKRVEVTGTLKPMESASGGPTADLPGSRDVKLREFEVATVRAASGGSCPTPAAQ